MPRTVHAITNVLVESHEETRMRVKSVFHTSVYDLRQGTSTVFTGRYEHEFVREHLQAPWLILRKRAVLVNDQIAGFLDFYSV